jgi:hypothetical protein
MEHQEIYNWLKELAFKNCDKKNREQIFWFFEDILEDEIKVETQEEEIERLNNRIEKAIDFLKENACIDEDVGYFCDDLRYDDCKKLLDILKGSDKK